MNPVISVRREAIKDALIAAPAVGSWAWVTGMAMAQSGLLHREAVGFSVISYAGTAQLAALPLMVAGAPFWVSFVSALMVNLRFIIYSAALRPSFRHLSFFKRIRLAVIVSDMGFGFYMQREERWLHHPERDRYFWWLGILIYLVWNAASLLGIFAATLIPPTWGIKVGGTLVLVALLVPVVRSVPELAAAVVAGGIAIVAHELPLNTATLVAIVSGIAVALWLDGLKPHEQPR